MGRQDRRCATRYRAVEDRARVGWWEGKHFRSAPARIEDISTGGASVCLGQEPLNAQGVWVRLAGTGPDQWVQAQLVGVATAEDGSQVVRLAFPQSCPYEMFKAVVWGEPTPQSPSHAHSNANANAMDAADLTPEVVDATPAINPFRRPSPTAPEVSAGDGPGYVVVVSMPFGSVPTLCEAERAVRAGKDRIGILTWASALAVGLVVAVVLGLVIVQKLGTFRSVDFLLKTARH